MKLGPTLILAAIFTLTTGVAAASEEGRTAIDGGRDAPIPSGIDVTVVEREVDNAPAAAGAMPTLQDEGGRARPMEVLTIELEKVGLGTGRLGRPGMLRNRANEEATAHCPDNKCLNEDPIGGELYTDFASVAFVASRTLMSTGMVVWLVSARNGTERQASLGPRLGGISFQGTF